MMAILSPFTGVAPTITPKPFQGLKPFLRTTGRLVRPPNNYPQTLSGIETP